ncbi:hypothetical protein BVZ47_00660B, partial [Haemophilus influenzae]
VLGKLLYQRSASVKR